MSDLGGIPSNNTSQPVFPQVKKFEILRMSSSPLYDPNVKVMKENIYFACFDTATLRITLLCKHPNNSLYFNYSIEQGQSLTILAFKTKHVLSFINKAI